MATIGLDFGSSNSTLSWYNPVSGKVEAVFFEGDATVKVPSGIVAQNNKLYEGFEATGIIEDTYGLSEQQRFELLSNYIPSLKRIMDPRQVEFLGDKKFTHRQLLEIYVQYMVERASEHCGRNYKIDSVVFTYPVDFSKEKIDLMSNALENVGLKVESCLPEPEAAAYGHGAIHEVNEGDGILIFDFGGGTVDVAYAIKKGKHFKLAVPPKGNSHCGGRDIDNVIYEYFRKIINKDKGIDISENGVNDPGIMLACRRLKERFSGKEDEYATGTLLINKGKVEMYKLSLTRQRFNELISPVVDNAVHVAKEVISSVRERNYPLNRIVMIGGSSNLVLLEEQLNLLSDATIVRGGEKDIAVAMGALVYEMNKEEQRNETSETLKDNTDAKKNTQKVANEKYDENEKKEGGVIVVPPDKNDGILDIFS